MRIERFEDIHAWQEARELTKMVYGWITDGKFGKDYGLRDQIQRASVSIMANISEGFDSGSKIEFIRFMTYARRSASETQSHLYTAWDQKYLTSEEFQQTYAQAVSTKNLIGGFIRYLAGKKSLLEHRRTEAREN